MRRVMKKDIYYNDGLYLVVRDGTYYAFGTFNGRRVRESCRTTELPKAKEFLDRRVRELSEGWHENYQQADADWRDVAETVWRRHKYKSQERGIPFFLQVADVYNLMRATGFRCAVSGIPFAKSRIDRARRDPWAPSIDRIENRQGYTLENVRVVCAMANVAMSDWGLDALIRLSRGVQRSSFCVAQEPEELTHQESSGASKDDNALIIQ